jgi:TP901 family phage tail tape measure protein
MVDIGSAVGYLLLDSTGFKQGFKTAFNDLQVFKNESATLNDKLLGVSSTLKNVGGTLTSRVTAPLVGAGIGAVKFASDFDYGMKQVSTIADTTAVSMEDLKKGTLELSDDMNVSATEMAGAMYDLLSSGTATADVLSYLEQSAMLAKGGFTDIGTAVDGATSVLNAYGLQGEEAFKRVSDIMVKTQDVGKTTVGELASQLSAVIPTAAAMGVEFEGVGAALATMTAQGTPTAQATTQLNALFAELGKKGTEAQKSLEFVTEGTELAGMSFQDMIASGIPLNEILELMRTKAEENGVSLLDLFGSMEAGKAALQMAGEGGKIFADALVAMGDSAGTTEKNFKTMSDAANEGFSGMLISIQNVGIEIGEKLLPFILDVVGGIKDLVNKFSDLDEGTKNTILTIAGIIAVGGPILLLLSGLITSVTTIGAALGTLGTFLFGTAEATGALSAAFAFLAANPVILIVAAIAGLVALIVHLWKINEDFRNALTKIWENIVVAFEAAGAKIKTNFDILVNFFTTLPETLKTIGTNLVEGFVNGITEKAEWVKDKVLGFVQGIKDIFTGKQGFDTHSPSLWGESQGEYIDEGIAGGIIKKADRPKWAMEQVTKPVKAEIKSLAEAVDETLAKFNGSIELTVGVIEKEFQLWQVMNTKLAGSSEELSKKLNVQKEQQEQLTQQIQLAEKALQDIVSAYGASSDEALKLKNSLLDLQIEHANLTNSINETSKAYTGMADAATAARIKAFDEKRDSGGGSGIGFGDRSEYNKKRENYYDSYKDEIDAISKENDVDLGVAQELHRNGTRIENNFNITTNEPLDAQEIIRQTKKAIKDLLNK